MKNTHLILFEGISGSGKSYSSQLLSLYLAREGYQVKWLYENTEKEAIYGAQDILSLADKNACYQLHKKALLKWGHLVEKAIEKDIVYIVDGHFLQMHITTSLSFCFDNDFILEQVNRVSLLIKKLNPLLIYFKQSDVKKSLRSTFDTRGKDFENYVLNAISSSDLGRKKHLGDFHTIADGFFVKYNNLLNEIFLSSRFDKLCIENPHHNWNNSSSIIEDFLLIPNRLDNYCPQYLSLAAVGSYKMANGDDIFYIVEDDKKLYLLTSIRLRLFFKASDSLFYIEGTENKIIFKDSKDNGVNSFIYKESNGSELIFVKIQ